MKNNRDMYIQSVRYLIFVIAGSRTTKSFTMSATSKNVNNVDE